MDSAEEKGNVALMGRGSGNLWDLGEIDENSTVDGFMRSSPEYTNYSDADTQEWTIEDMAETNETIQMLEKIVKAQFSISDEVEASSNMFVSVDGGESPSPNIHRDSISSNSNSYQRRNPNEQKDDRVFDGKDSIFTTDTITGRPRKLSLTRGSSDNLYTGKDMRPPRSPVNRGDKDGSESSGE